MNKIIFVWDFLYHDSSSWGTYHWWVIDSFRNLVTLATGIEVQELNTMKNAKGEVFSRQKFYELSGYQEISEIYFNYDITKIKKESIEYFKSFVDENTFVFGVELGIDMCNILSEMGLIFLNIWHHSWKLFDDAFLMFATNNEEIFNKLNNYKVPQARFYFYANYWRIFAEQKGEWNYLNDLSDNACCFVGQTMMDKSIDDNGTLLNILNFKEKIKELAEQYSKVYYIPHPYTQYNEDLEDYLANTSYIEKLENASIYHLLMSNKIKKFISISSSVIYEAKFFGKEVEYLFQPLLKIDEDYSINTFISIFHDYYNPYFWADVLSPIIQTDLSVENKNYFYDTSNKLRNIRHFYYGYAGFNELERYRTFNDSRFASVETCISSIMNK